MNDEFETEVGGFWPTDPDKIALDQIRELINRPKLDQDENVLVMCPSYKQSAILLDIMGQEEGTKRTLQHLTGDFLEATNGTWVRFTSIHATIPKQAVGLRFHHIIQMPGAGARTCSQAEAMHMLRAQMVCPDKEAGQ
jgi:hypothetical protein